MDLSEWKGNKDRMWRLKAAWPPKLVPLHLRGEAGVIAHGQAQEQGAPKPLPIKCLYSRRSADVYNFV